MRTKKRIKDTVILCMGLIFSLCACGTKAAVTVPELLEPVSVNEAYRAVTLGELGNVEIEYAKVKSKEYPEFYSTNVTISEILVEIGDYVEAGQVLAYGDVEGAKEQLLDLKKQLSREQQIFAINEKIFQLNLQQETDSLAISTMKENQNYDTLLYRYRIEKLQEEIRLQEELVQNGTLIAHHSGYVSYIKNLASGEVAGATESIVMISNPEEMYLEMESLTTETYTYSDYEVKYMLNGEEKIPVTEREYTSQEKVLAKANGRSLFICFDCPNQGEYVVGDTYPIYFMEKDFGEVLLVGNDSVYREGDTSYVYVKNEAGEKERRDIVVGEQDLHNTQVVSGLEAGELVYYESDAQMPAEYVEYTVTREDFSIENLSATYQNSYGKTFVHNSEHNGTIISMAVEDGQEVEKGQLLYEIQSDTGKAALTEARQRILREKESNENALKEMDKQIAESADSQKEILLLQKQLMEIKQAEAMESLEKEYARLSQGNNGSGVFKIFADVAGTITRISVKEGDMISEGQSLFSIRNLDKNLILVQMREMQNEDSYVDNIADLGETITLSGPSGTGTGSCIGWICASNNSGKGYLYREGEETYLAYCAESGYDYPGFYVELSEEDQGKDVFGGKVSFSYVSMKKAIVLPKTLVYSERSANNSSEQDYYVWKLEQGEMIKQYVQISEKLTSDGSMVILYGLKVGDVLADEIS